MDSNHFTTSFLVDQTPEEAFAAIMNVRGWWTENLEGQSEKLNDEFEVRFRDVHYSRHKIIEIVPNKKVVWLGTDSQLNFINQKSEWTDTKIIFEISKQGGQTQVRFTHAGLVPEYECFEACSNAWTQNIRQSLLSLITTGKGQPGTKEDAPLTAK